MRTADGLSPTRRRGRLFASLAVLLPSAGVVAGVWLARHDGEAGAGAGTTTLIVRGHDARALAHATWTPSALVKRARVLAGALELDVDAKAAGAGTIVRVDVPDACPVEVTVQRADAARSIETTAAPWLSVDEERAQIGFDTPFRITVVPGCPEAGAGTIAWSAIEGGPVPDLRTSERGFVVEGRTVAPKPRSQPASHEASDPWGIVPFSPRTQGAYTLEMVWRDERRPGVRRVVHVTAIARATGLPSIALGQRVVLAGTGWHVTEHPRDGAAVAHPSAWAPGERAAEFAADALGRWVLEDGDGRALALRVGRHDLTPLDCGRAECHANAAHAIADSPMTNVLARGLDGAFGDRYDASCAVRCHAAGEPGLEDGGFVAVARELGVILPKTPPLGGWASLPRALRRLGGVGCTSCHGPAAIPEKNERGRILATDVCASCHDAPPRYGHVDAWRSSRMARADAAAGTAGNAACAPCHTTAGFLAAAGVRPLDDPPSPLVSGIACAACHAPHGAHEGRLVRTVRRPTGYEKMDLAPTSAVCLGCHTPFGLGRASDLPSGSAAALLLGRGGARESEDSSTAEGPHSKLACTACHAGRAPDALAAAETLGRSHSFAAPASTCAPCHRSGLPDVATNEAALRARAGADYAQLVARGVVRPARAAGGRGAAGASVARSSAPAHASSPAIATSDGTLAAAAWKASMVVEDPAAYVHNAPFARRLLDEVEAALAGAPAAAAPSDGHRR